MKSVDLDTSEVISIALDVIYNDNDESISVENGRTENSNKRKHSSGASSTASPKIASEFKKVPVSKKARKQTDESAKHPEKKSSPTKNKSPIIDVEADIHIDTELTPDTVVMTKMISKLSADMRTMFSDVNDRISTLEEKLEQKLTQKFNQILDKRVNSESSKIRKDVNKIVDALRSDIDQDLKVVEDKLDGVSKTVGEIGSRATNQAQDISKKRHNSKSSRGSE
ncbi:Hypothetical predicted protein [Mytilus galloprovincialis]|uniref:Uncharacterized protein n=1 Tax=Mytilus galloprovincialis TaxID=29158 RepID=A0A8B6F4D2_MYTGA|nr:Hypothetical predicted protein [Mytilus galloprovincialis]